MKSVLVKILSPLIRFYRLKIRGMSHQRLDIPRMRKKWTLLETELGDKPGSVLDIGCNEGFFPQFAAQAGWFSIGVDIDAATIQFARNNNMDLPNVGFMNAPVSTPFIETLPHFDVILFLSAFQEVYVALGREEALECFGALLSKCRKKLLLETASTSAKYGEDALFASDNDETAITAWVNSLVAPYPDWRVRAVGATSYSDTEPYRYLYAIERIDS